MFNRRNHTMKINSVFNKTLLFVGAIVCTIGLQSCLDDDDNNAYYLRYPNALVTVKGAADDAFFLQLDDNKPANTCDISLKYNFL